MYKYTFLNGKVVTSRLTQEEMLYRMNRLDKLRTLIECNECEEAENIMKKVLKAYNKTENFTGIIHLSFQEKDWLSYILESDMLDAESIETIKFYCK